MSIPRAVVPGRVYMLTRRCSERRFFMRPDAETNNAFVYCLALAAEAYQVDVIFTAAMSNHHHTGIVDVHGRLPDFLAYFHKLFAKHQNALRGRWEAFWAPEQTSAVELVGADDIVDKMVYALTNPVKDQLVEKLHHWPGVDAASAIIAGGIAGCQEAADVLSARGGVAGIGHAVVPEAARVGETFARGFRGDAARADREGGICGHC